MNIETIVTGVISNKHGWAVAEQFEDTWYNKNFEEQNHNALTYIKDTINDLLNSDIFSEEVESELVDYLFKLKDYLAYPG
jgi:hypothetical protein